MQNFSGNISTSTFVVEMLAMCLLFNHYYFGSRWGLDCIVHPSCRPLCILEYWLQLLDRMRSICKLNFAACCWTVWTLKYIVCLLLGFQVDIRYSTPLARHRSVVIYLHLQLSPEVWKAFCLHQSQYFLSLG